MTGVDEIQDIADLGMKGGLPRSAEGDIIKLWFCSEEEVKLIEDFICWRIFCSPEGEVVGFSTFTVDAVQRAGAARHEIYSKSYAKAA